MQQVLQGENCEALLSGRAVAVQGGDRGMSEMLQKHGEAEGEARRGGRRRALTGLPPRGRFGL